MEEDIKSRIFKYKIYSDKKSFKSYLREVWKDLKNRTSTRNIQKSEKIKGITFEIFLSFYSLPLLISKRLFKIMNNSLFNVLLIDDFVEGITDLFYYDEKEYNIFSELYNEKASKLIFKICDFDNDGYITKEDINLISLYIPFPQGIINEKLFLNKSTINYENFISPSNKLFYQYILLFLLKNTPFHKFCLSVYEKQINSNDNEKLENRRRSISSKNTLNQIEDNPRRKNCFNEIQSNEKIISLGYNNNLQNYFEYSMLSCPNLLIENSQINNQYNFTFKNINNSKRYETESSFGRNSTTMSSYFTNDIDFNYTHNNYFEQKHTFENKKNSNLKNINYLEYNESEDENYYEEEKINFDDIIVPQQCGYLFKQSSRNGLFKKTYYKLYGKDLYFFSNCDSLKHEGMHILINVFIKEDYNPVYINGKLYYPFSIIYSNHEKIYYAPDNESKNKWVIKLKTAINYEDLNDKYIIMNQIGKGRFASVYLGFNKKTNKKVAIKILDKNEMDDEDIKLTYNEIELLKICKNEKKIVNLYRNFENENYFYLVLEYCEDTLLNYLQERNFLIPEKDAKKIILKLCEIISYLHKKGICHRDIKIENILLIEKNNINNIILSDLGLSTLLYNNEKKNEPYGTITYVAPEVLNKEFYDKKIDCWSLGVISYLLLGGCLPFNSENNEEIFHSILLIEPNYENLINRGISYIGINFVKKLLNKNPNNRLNIEEALNDIYLKSN